MWEPDESAIYNLANIGRWLAGIAFVIVLVVYYPKVALFLFQLAIAILGNS